MPFRIRTILAATDLSGSADEVLRTAAALAALAGADLHVVHAVEEPDPDAAGGAEAEERREAAERMVRDQIRSAVPSGAKISSTRVAPGRPHEVVLQRADDSRADLLVIGPHKERPGGGRSLGTTADRIVRTSGVPCLIVRHPVSLPLRRVLVPSDLSDAAEGALDIALIWSAALRLPRGSPERTALEVVYVLAPTTSGIAPARGRAEIERLLHEEVDAGCERTGCGSSLAISENVLEADDIPDEILRHAHETDVGLMVMGTHGESALARGLIGSASSAVARRAVCPVLLVPPGLWKLLRAREAAVRPVA